MIAAIPHLVIRAGGNALPSSSPKRISMHGPPLSKWLGCGVAAVIYMVALHAHKIKSLYY